MRLRSLMESPQSPTRGAQGPMGCTLVYIPTYSPLVRSALRHLLSCKKNVVCFLAEADASRCNKLLIKRYLAGSMEIGGGGPSPRWILPIWELVRQSIPRCIVGSAKASFEGSFAASTTTHVIVRRW